MKLNLRPFFPALCLIALPFVGQADTRAVLVGVGDYLHLDADLKGPVNDVGLMADTLMRRGVSVQNMTVLADVEARAPEGVARALPDREDILNAFEAAIMGSASGDTVVFYFSGHGAQTPDLNGDEGGGMDEIFLPRDARGWNRAAGVVENAILDDELGAFTELAAARGVKLVAIIDACHSGTGFRALGGAAESRARYITPAQLGLPDASGDAAPATTPERAPPGDYVFLYAAQSDQRAFEYPVGEDRIWHGDFTRALTTTMTEVPDLSYSDLVQAAALRMQMKSGQAAQTPDIEGPLAGSPVLGGDAPGLARIALEGQTLQAGMLQDITVGSTLTLYAGLLDADPVGQAVVDTVNATTASIRFVEPFPTVKVAFAQVMERAMDTSVRFQFSAAAKERLAAFGGIDALADRLDLEINASNPTHSVVLAQDTFAVVGPDGVLDGAGPGRSPRLNAGSLGDLEHSLTTVAGRLRFERALAQFAQGSASGVGSFALVRTDPDIAFELVAGAVRGDRCARQGNTDAPVRVIADHADAAHCDRLTVRISNGTAKMQDVSVLYVDAASAISVLWPTRNLSNRIEVGGDKVLNFGLRHVDPTVIHESVIVLSVPAEAGSTRTQFNHVGTSERPRAAQSAMASFLTEITDPAKTRGLSLKPKGPSLSVTRLDLTLLPTGD